MRLRNYFISVVMLVLIVYGGLKLFMLNNANDKIQQVLTCVGMPPEVRQPPQFDYKKLSASLFGYIGIRDLSFHNPQLHEEITIGEVRLQNFHYAGRLADCPVPDRLSIAIKDVQFNVSFSHQIFDFRFTC